MALTDAQQVALDLAEIYARPCSARHEWLPITPAGAESLIAGYEVLPHVQAFDDAVRRATGVRATGTYPGHSPSIDRAIDLFHAVGDNALANAISQFAIAAQRRYGVRYVIDRQQIWHRLDPVWRDMADRGDNTQNHRDHNHVSFELVAADVPEPVPPTPPPVPPQEEVTMFVFDGPPERGGGVWKSDGVWRNRITNGETWPALDAAGAKHIGVAPVGLFDDLIDADLEGYAGGVDLSAIADRVAARVADMIADRLAS